MLTPNHLTKSISEYLSDSEYGDAEMFADLFSPNLAYDHSCKKWYIFDKHYWKEDKTGQVNNAVRFVALEYKRAAAQLEELDPGSGKDFVRRHDSVLTKQRIDHILKVASSIPTIGLVGDEWSIPPMCLPVANGIIDLATGKLVDGKPSDYINVYSPTDYVGLTYPAPNWEKFISDICGDDDETISFLQRLLGYAITGDTREQIMPIFLGEGANGKSSLMDTLRKVLGSAFCFSTQADSLMNTRMSNGEGAKPFVCALQHKRIVWASESQEGQALNIGLIKQLTGDQNITARNLYSKPTTFTPSHVIFLITNSLPNLQNRGDYAIKRRLPVIPFNIRFVDDPKNPEERKVDKDLLRKMQNEGPGILAWLVTGASNWQRKGLIPTEASKMATTNYHINEDVTGKYIKENLVAGETCDVLFSEIYSDLTSWCDDNGFAPTTKKELGQKLTQQFGESYNKTVDGKSYKAYRGIRLYSKKP